jgi:hypothetical protein
VLVAPDGHVGLLERGHIAARAAALLKDYYGSDNSGEVPSSSSTLRLRTNSSDEDPADSQHLLEGVHPCWSSRTASVSVVLAESRSLNDDCGLAVNAERLQAGDITGTCGKRSSASPAGWTDVAFNAAGEAPAALANLF